MGGFVDYLRMLLGWSSGSGATPGGLVCATVTLAPTVSATAALSATVSATVALAPTVSATAGLEEC